MRIVLLTVLGLGLLVPSTAAAQDPTTSSTTLVEVPSQDIVPAPNRGEEPQEAGDRGGALQLGLLALLVAVVAGAVVILVRQSRAARRR